MRITKITYLFFLIILLASCKKDAALDPLAYVIFPKNGIIRVECADCSLNYTVLNTNYTVQVKNSQDITFSYISDFELKTTIDTQKKQVVRLTVFDSYGRIITNELQTLNPGDNKTDYFKIKIN